jgi:N utilization substance protein A
MKGAKTATVVVPEDQLSLAIGRDGQNARLAAKLTSWRIDIKSLPEAAADALHKLQNDPDYAFLIESEREVVPQVEAILAKKAEGRPVTPEEYHLLTQFVDRVERGLIRQRLSEQKQEEERERIARANVPASAFEIPLEKFDVSDHVYAVISEAGLQTVGDLMLQMRLEPDSILKLNGMGPKGIKELQDALDRLSFPEEEAAKAAEAAELAEAPAGAVEAMPGAAEAAEAVVSEPVLMEEAHLAAPPVAAAPIAAGVEAEPVEVLPETEEAAMALAPTVEGEPPAEKMAGEPVVTEEPAPVEVAPEVEEAASLDEIFALRPEVLQFVSTDEESEEEEEGDLKKKKKRKKRFIEVEYDPEKDVTIAKKKRKRGDLDWEGW